MMTPFFAVDSRSRVRVVLVQQLVPRPFSKICVGSRKVRWPRSGERAFLVQVAEVAGVAQF